MESGDWTATELVDDAVTKAGIASVEKTAADLSSGAGSPIATNIRLIGVCMRAFPDILTGQDFFGAPCTFLKTALRAYHSDQENKTSLNSVFDHACRQGEGDGCDVPRRLA